MSRALTLFRRLEHLGEPDISEEDDDMMMKDGDKEQKDNEQPAPGMPQQQQRQQAPMAEPNSPFSKDLRNPDGSMKVGDTDQTINDKTRGTTPARAAVKESRFAKHQRTYERRK